MKVQQLDYLRFQGESQFLNTRMGGLEMTLVISGAYSDITGKYARGDFQEADEEVEHRPIVEIGEECICLIVTNAPLRFSNLTTRIVQPILGV